MVSWPPTLWWQQEFPAKTPSILPIGFRRKSELLLNTLFNLVPFYFLSHFSPIVPSPPFPFQHLLMIQPSKTCGSFSNVPYALSSVDIHICCSFCLEHSSSPYLPSWHLRIPFRPQMSFLPGSLWGFLWPMVSAPVAQCLQYLPVHHASLWRLLCPSVFSTTKQASWSCELVWLPCPCKPN